MRTVTLKSIIHYVAKAFGIDVQAGDYDDQLVSSIIAFIEPRVREGWEWGPWPELLPCQRRQYRNTWSSGTTYAAADEIYYNDNYYYSLQAANVNKNPETETAWWVLVADVDDDEYVFDKYVELDQSWEDTPIGEVFSVSAKNPRKSDFPGYYEWTLSPNGIEPSSLAGNRVYVLFRYRPPEFTSTEWDATVAYAIGDLVYYDTTGQCYKATQAGTNQNPATETDYWELQPVPFVISNFVKYAAYADKLLEDGQKDAAQRKENQAYQHLANAWDVVEAQQGQQKRAGVKNYY